MRGDPCLIFLHRSASRVCTIPVAKRISSLSRSIESSEAQGSTSSATGIAGLAMKSRGVTDPMGSCTNASPHYACMRTAISEIVTRSSRPCIRSPIRELYDASNVTCTQKQGTRTDKGEHTGPRGCVVNLQLVLQLVSSSYLEHRIFL